MTNLILDALNCKQTKRPPIWLMRQAGRYMKEYRDLKEKYSFLDLCMQPDLATQVTLMPIKKFGFDAAIMFADILLILHSLGCDIGFEKGYGPWVDTKNHLENIEKLPIYEVSSKLGYIQQTIKNLKEELSVPLLGFCGAPFTLATYVLEKKSSKTFDTTKHWLFWKPNQLHFLLKVLTKQSIAYLKMQVEAGVDAVQIFDSWAGYFPSYILKEFCFPYLKQIVDAMKKLQVPVILFAKGSSLHLDELVKMNPTAISLDESCSLSDLAPKIPSHIAIQGNLDPNLLFAPEETLKKHLISLCQSMRSRAGYIVNLGHGIKPQSLEGNVQCMVETVQNISF